MANFFYTDANGCKQGPYSNPQLQELATQGIITPYTPLETDGGHTGVAGQIPGLNFNHDHNTAAPDFLAQTGQASLPRVPDYLVWSILSTRGSCVPLGIAAIIFSCKCKSDLTAGHYDSAVKNSKTAFWCNLVSLVVIGIVYVFYFILIAIGAISEM
jgi:hypothetical protein